MVDFLKSSVGKKYLMGLTGLVWVGFVLAHMLGNLLIFVSPEAYNSYGHALTSGNIIYIAETVLVVALVSHVFLAISLTIANKKSRASRYAMSPNGAKGSSVASNTMAIHGIITLFFIIYHLITFKFGSYYETTVHGVVMRDLHRLVLEVFQNPLYVVGYIVCLGLLGLHLKHGSSSVFQSFGILTRSNEKTVKCLSSAYAAIVTLGFLSQPIYVFLFNR